MSVIDEAKAIWKRVHTGNENSVSAVAWIGKDGEFAHYLSGACHAMLTSPAYYLNTKVETEKKPKIGSLVSVFSGIQVNRTKLKNKPEVERTFIEWLLFQSPFKDAFLKTTTVDSLDNRVLMGDAENTPANLMGAGLMATRIFNEHPSVLTTWWNLVNHGVHPSVAFVFGHRIYIDDEGRVQRHRPGHTGCFNSYLGSYADDNGTKSYVLNFLQGKTNHLSDGNYNKKYGESIQSFRLWNGENKDAKGVPLPAEIHDVIAKVGSSGGKSANPFGKAKLVNTGGAPLFSEAVEVIVPFLNRYKEFF